MRHFRTPVIALLLLGTSLAACRRAKPPATTPNPAANAPGGAAVSDADRDRELAEARRIQQQRDSMDRALAAAQAQEENDRRAREAARALEEQRASERAAGGVARIIGAVILFEYDRAELSEQARTSLAAKAQVMQTNRGIRIRIVGHTDSRGADEYNLALGQRRSAAAKRYLMQLGVADDRIEITSMGEEQPVALGEDETAWGQNRRAEFTIIADGTEANR
jgi:peptidoglycan-associated lipoprotein